MRSTWLVCVMLLGVLALGGCSNKDESSTACTDCATQLVDQASVALSQGNYEEANAKYLQAVGNDPNNLRAQTGVAITGLYLIQNDPEVVRILNTTLPAPRSAGRLRTAPASLTNLWPSDRNTDLGPEAMRERVLGAFSLAATDPVALSDAQNVIATRVLPRLQDAETRLNRVEANPNFSYPVTVLVGSDLFTVDVDLGEIYTLDAVLNGVQGWLGMLVAYNFDVPGSDYANVPPDSLLATGTQFGTLHPTGAAQLISARTNLLLVKARFDQAARFIAEETDDQADDVIPISALDMPDYAAVKAQIDEADLALRDQVTITLIDHLGAAFPAALDLSRFFAPAIADLKTKLPVHTFDVLHQPVITDPITFPDPTMNGILPDMTNDRWRALVGAVAPARVARR